MKLTSGIDHVQFGRRAVVAAAVLSALAVLSIPAAPAAAQTCASTPVRAEGDRASFQWLALVKAKGDWRAKVRAMPELGPAYANWAAATDQVERCIKDAKSVRCIVSARPCRR